jgi:phytoene/squalene synthetase
MEGHKLDTTCEVVPISMRTMTPNDDQNQLQASYEYCERIARQNRPHLYTVANFFYDPKSYYAFCATYASMRIIDDVIDNIEGRQLLTDSERQEFIQKIDDWLVEIHSCLDEGDKANPIATALTDAFRYFPIPLRFWDNLAKAMKEDLEKDRFQTFDEYLAYTEGAAIAPATIFMYFLTFKKDGRTYSCVRPDLDPYVYAKPMAIFCYVAHILRDISVDLELNKTGLIYMPLKDLESFSVSEEDLFEFKRTGMINANFRSFMMFMAERATSYETESYKLLTELSPYLGQDAKFILTLLLALYSETLRRIERVDYNVFGNTHHLTECQKMSLILTTARKYGYSLLRIIRIYWNVLVRNRSIFRYAELHS